MNLPLACWWDLWIFDTILPWFFMCTTTGAAVWAWFRSRLPWWLGGTRGRVATPPVLDLASGEAHP